MEMDWYCQTYRCWMFRKACDKRRKLAGIKTNWASNSIYNNAGCGTCTQAASIDRPLPITTHHHQEVVMENIPAEKPCTRCKKTKLMDAFSAASQGKYGKKPTCKQCDKELILAWRNRRAKKELQPLAESLSVFLGKTEHGIEKQQSPDLQPACQPEPEAIQAPDVMMRAQEVIGLPTSISTAVLRAPKTIVLALDNHPEIYDAVISIAKDEFRTPDMQVLYWMAQQVIKDDIHRANR